MTATNHYLVGVASAAALQNPIIALPVALASHFVLDALPHFGLKYSKRNNKVLIAVAIFDLFLLSFAIALTISNFTLWQVVAGLLAVSPDFAWVYRFIVKTNFGKLPPPPSNAFNTWHSQIQRYESKSGAIVEIVALIGLVWWLF